jgi:hypothetical protein
MHSFCTLPFKNLLKQNILASNLRIETGLDLVIGEYFELIGYYRLSGIFTYLVIGKAFVCPLQNSADNNIINIELANHALFQA